ncbi:hypothetical protein CDA63_11160 [Hymenobacter amundsenii]|uniref:Uncharacterized protein n=1 Tax=Hymenobacter amundsenii TaxID=2006685 RepID=A0A246FNB0_9BACT|nr:hypothetical protein [Hymenobacter amundsenii]OWP63083.1 hypothetical protein CDA63_11160 [Hymenobacter amundsenii]
MKYLFTILLLATVQLSYAQSSLLLNGIRTATNVGRIAARANNNKTKIKQKSALAPEATSSSTASTVGQPAPIMPFTYRGQAVSRQRTTAETIKGKGASEILALEAALEQTHQALLADSAQSFLPATQNEAIIAAARKAATVRPAWNYSAYQQELAFYQQEETRRMAPAPAPAPAKPVRKPRK